MPDPASGDISEHELACKRLDRLAAINEAVGDRVATGISGV
jgi:hypothetical protein